MCRPILQDALKFLDHRAVVQLSTVMKSNAKKITFHEKLKRRLYGSVA
jgi:hypothetical protein